MLLSQLSKVELKAKASKLYRLLANPINYIQAIGYRQLIYPLRKKGWMVRTKTFWKQPFWVKLPSGTDIFLTGGKSDDSEIRLARFLIRNLSTGDTFIDVGSHFGYFSCLAAQCMDGKGNVLALEPTLSSFQVLQRNVANVRIINAIHCLVGSESGEQSFFEFPVNYSEYNTTRPEQFENASWYQKANVRTYKVRSLTLDHLLDEYHFMPTLIKIDTEGAEAAVIKGAQHTLATHKQVLIVMEFLSASRGNTPHQEAAALLLRHGYQPFTIETDGTLKPCPDIEAYLNLARVESDNLVFKHSG